MVIKMDNKADNFYNIMGKFFGSRIVQNKTNDRIFDDKNKEWYIFLDNDMPVAFVSVVIDVIKNVYAINDDYLIELLNYINKKMKIKDSVVTTAYTDVYKKCGFICSNDNGYKNFIVIRSDISE